MCIFGFVGLPPHIQLRLGYGHKHQPCKREDICRSVTGVRALPGWCCRRRSVFAPYAAPSVGASAADAAQGFFPLAPLTTVLQRQRNLKQKYFCEKQGKGSVGTQAEAAGWPCIAVCCRQEGRLQPLQQRLPGATSQLKWKGQTPLVCER